MIDYRHYQTPRSSGLPRGYFRRCHRIRAFLERNAAELLAIACILVLLVMHTVTKATPPL